MNRYPNAAGGLKLMLIGQIVIIVGALLSWIPLVGALAVIAGQVVEILGMYKAGEDDQGYRTALMCTAVNLILSVISSFLQQGVLTSLISVVSSVLSLIVVYLVCTTTANLLHSVDNEALSERGATVVKIYVACTVVSIVCQVLSVVPILNIVAGLVSIVALVAQVVGYIMYLTFVSGSSKAL